MPHFYHRDKKIFVSTNFKVMYSSLSYFSKKDKDFNFIRIDFRSNFQIPYLEHYLLVRNPYKRVISFYKDKLLRFPYRDKTPYLQWRYVEKLIFPYLDIDEQLDSEKKIIEKLSHTSLTYFIHNILPYIYHLDTHLTPQSWIVFPRQYKNGRTVCVNFKEKLPVFKNVKIVKIESKQEMKKFAEKINFDLTIKKHSTQNFKNPLLTSNNIKSIYQIYEKDFTIFNYPKLF